MMLGPAASVQQKIMVGSFMIKKAYSVQMSYNVTDVEKSQAEQALLCFTHTLKCLKMAYNYLNIMKTPFKDNSEMNPEEVMKARSAIRRFRDKTVDNFNEFKQNAFKCINVMQSFASDTQTVKLMKSFITSIDTLEIKVNDFVDIFTDLQSKDFPKNVVKNIEDIQKDCDEIEEIIDERIRDHIQNNILATSWVDSVSNDLQMKIEQKTPLVLDLFNRRQDQLNDIVKNRSDLGN